ncbi:hypothetical protein GUJ93_ZPchr0004g39242 [Zizania palustris]|uniref:Uncharacterized protein n=1 Tax=Zizania palustris TaxID=103762 RepID=A0A8J5VFG0_ZIZPA|nr:hypothetical protein GUJ93_ZPchr0004g39242 [Zizania palustris]
MSMVSCDARFTCLPLPLLTLLSPSEVSSSSPALVMGFFFLLLRDKGNMTREEEAKIQACKDFRCWATT